MGIITLSVRTIETRLPGDMADFRRIPAHVIIWVGIPFASTVKKEAEGNITGAGDYIVDTLGASAIIQIEAKSVKNPLKTIKAGFYTLLDPFGNVFKTGTTHLIEAHYSWEKDSWEFTLAPRIVHDDAALGVKQEVKNPFGAWHGMNLESLNLPSLPTLPDLGGGLKDMVIWIAVGIIALIIIIVIVMKG